VTDVVWLLALFVAAANPARHTGRVPGRAAAVAALLGLAAVGAVAGLSEPLLDALDVSLPSARIGVGVVVGVAGVRDMVRADAAVWEPVALRPELVLPALVAGADEGVLLTAIAAAVAIALTAVAATRPPAATRRPLTRGAARLLGGVLLVLGVDLVVDGVLDV